MAQITKNIKALVNRLDHLESRVEQDYQLDLPPKTYVMGEVRALRWALRELGFHNKLVKEALGKVGYHIGNESAEGQ
jgi:hypothetical protein